PADHVEVTRRGFYTSRQMLQYQIANHVAVSIIDFLEEIEIRHDEAQRAALVASTHRSFDVVFERLHEPAVVYHTCQLVGPGSLLQARCFCAQFIQLFFQLIELRKAVTFGGKVQVKCSEIEDDAQKCSFFIRIKIRLFRQIVYQRLLYQKG